MPDEHDLHLEPASRAKHPSSGSSHTESGEPPQIMEPCRVTSAVPFSANTHPGASQPEVRTSSGLLGENLPVLETLFDLCFWNVNSNKDID